MSHDPYISDAVVPKSRALVTTELREVNIPFFPGFYESALAGGLDYAEAAVVEYLTSDDVDWNDPRFRARDMADVADAIYWTTDYPAVYRALAEEWVRSLAYYFDSDEDLGQIAWAGMESPRQYNFTTDRVFVTATLETIRSWRRYVDPDEMTAIARERHTSRSGFISFYEPDWTTWGPVEDWDLNQLGTLFVACLATRGADERDVLNAVEESLCENYDFANALDTGLDLDAAALRLREAA